jgi:3-hydroxyacyl-CoA dehydrogenase
VQKIAVIGAGAIGRAWAIVFARAGRKVSLYSRSAATLANARQWIALNVAGLQEFGLLEEPAAAIEVRIECSTDFAQALDGADHVQENIPEDIDQKKALYAQLDTLVPANVVLASSTSTIPASLFASDLRSRHRCLVAHPVNPPYLVPAVEICPAPFTSSEALSRTRTLLDEVGQAPIVLRKELPGFVMNRLQSVLACEAVRLVESGCVTTEELDRAVKDGLGLRWAFMGPLETLDLNSPGGFAEFAHVFAPIMHGIDAAPEAAARPWGAAAIAKIDAERRALVPLDEHAARIVWRDRQLMALIAHKRRAQQ